MSGKRVVGIVVAVLVVALGFAVSRWLRAEGKATEADEARADIEVQRLADSTAAAQAIEREGQVRAVNESLRQMYLAQRDSTHQARVAASHRYDNAVAAVDESGASLDSALARLAVELPEVGRPILDLRRVELDARATERGEHAEMVLGLMGELSSERGLREVAESDAGSLKRERDALSTELATTRAALRAADLATEAQRRLANPPLVLRIGRNLDLVLPAAGVGFVAGILAGR